MGLLEQEIKELRKLRKDFVSGKVSADNMYGQLSVYSQIEKRAKQILQAHALAAKFGKPVLNRITQTNLIGNGSCVEAEAMEAEMIKCPDQDRFISRNECLDYSGDSGHYDDCISCEHFKQTRNLLLGKKK